MRRIKAFIPCLFTLLLLVWLFISSTAWAVDLNSASRGQLVSIKGIGVKTAENIIHERQRGGPFLSVEDFSLRVKGIGSKRAKRLFEAGLQIKGEGLPLKATDASRYQPTSVSKKVKHGSLSAAEPRLIKPRAGNADQEGK